jgi:hypothetical protein
VTVATPLVFVAAGLPVTVPQAAPVAVKVTESGLMAVPSTPLVTVALTLEVVAPSAGMLDGVAVTAMLWGTAVWATPAEPVLPALTSVAVTVQVPGVVEAVYVTLATPLALVVAVLELNVPHTLAAPLIVKDTKSLATSFPVTVALMAEVVLPSAAMLAGVAVTPVRLVAVPCCVITVEAVLPVPASVAVTVQKPAVVLDVYVTAGALPPAPVVDEFALKVPHEPAGFALRP